MSRVFFYAREQRDTERRLRGVIDVLVPRDEIEVCRSVPELAQKLGRPKINGTRTLVVLVSSSLKDLEDLLSIHDLFDGAFVIMVLPEDDPESIALAHKMRSRFITYRASSFADVAGVAAKVLR